MLLRSCLRERCEESHLIRMPSEVDRSLVYLMDMLSLSPVVQFVSSAHSRDGEFVFAGARRLIAVTSTQPCPSSCRRGRILRDMQCIPAVLDCTAKQRIRLGDLAAHRRRAVQLPRRAAVASGGVLRDPRAGHAGLHRRRGPRGTRQRRAGRAPRPRDAERAALRRGRARHQGRALLRPRHRAAGTSVVTTTRRPRACPPR